MISREGVLAQVLTNFYRSNAADLTAAGPLRVLDLNLPALLSNYLWAQIPHHPLVGSPVGGANRAERYGL